MDFAPELGISWLKYHFGRLERGTTSDNAGHLFRSHRGVQAGSKFGERESVSIAQRSRSLPRLYRAAALGAMAWTFPAVAATWTNAVSGNWSDGPKWTPAGAPAGSDSATIAATGAAFTLTV